MPNREQQNYEDTKSFLEYYSDQGIKLAKLGYTCLILNEVRAHAWSLVVLLHQNVDM